MPTITEVRSASKKVLWAGKIISTLSLLFLGLDAILHLATPAPVVEAFARLGIPLSLSAPIGAIELACVALYAIPRTAVLGAVLLTGYLGGAVAIHVRAGSSLLETIFPVIVATLVWTGVFFREERLRSIIPVRSRTVVTQEREK
jgi:DoxX-like family